MSKKILIIAGEASGDLHAEKVVAAIKSKKPNVEFIGVGGDRMQAAGVKLYYHVKDLAFIGFVEIIKHLGFFKKIFNDLVELVQTEKPDLVVLVDYPGFNLRFGKKAKELGCPIFYYISPQVWAWRQGRAKKMAQFIDRMAVIFDFEVPFFQKYGIDTHFVGHPLVDECEAVLHADEFFAQFALDPQKKVLALFPGSRKQEIENLLPPMLQAAQLLQQKYPDLQVAVSKAETIYHDQIQSLLPDDSIKVVEHHAYDLMKNATAAMVTSGTATLETALFATPFCLLYKVSPFTFFLGKRLVKIPYIGLVNIVSQKKAVTEFIQDLDPQKISQHVELLLFDETVRNAAIADLKRVRKKLGSAGASDKTADLILEMLE